ncbi:thioredoxin reductase [Burkholderia lata]|uniref:Thioredoxin reductase n=1 Tax=Burkholderia lata (strain ATCC 17760 / DSM 23089 / LMG 22485 / NCIMB 9086 / R18194 / 383) TaxID=482957 RepID=A0A6P2TM40_BURL3|nr:RebB family R body protein [Burkholderia lata]VWC61592.1 thioredoxin reductase [Burkholderia lata]VWD41703.1 thioredoxin reductase [Burkholderia lata]
MANDATDPSAPTDPKDPKDPCNCKTCAVNAAITDAVTQTNVKVVGEAPAMATGSLYQAQSHSLSVLFENAVQQQSQSAVQLPTSTNVGTMQLYTLGPASAGAAATEIGSNGVLSVLADVLAIGKALA